MTQPASPRKLYIHIGLQKTGTSYLQQICWQSVDELRQQGVAMVPGTKLRTFWLMLDVCGRVRRFDPPAAGRAVDRLPAALAEASAYSALITEESLAGAKDEQIARLVQACVGREVHVVVTLRDFARQLPSDWQQRLQSGDAETFDDYLARLQAEQGRPTQIWKHKDIAAILSRWSRHVPAERIHVVTVPQSGADPELLLRRFCRVLDVDPGALNVVTGRANKSLRHVHAEVLRRVNAGLPRRSWRRDLYGDVGKRFFAVKVLGEGGGEKVKTPTRLEPYCRAVAEEQIEFIRGGGFDVVGDLEDLRPVPGAYSDAAYAPSERQVADAATKALAVILEDRMKDRREQIAANRRKDRTPRTTSERARLKVRQSAVTVRDRARNTVARWRAR
ncbi:hypothetical protein [Nocardioides insulae]|uniref:hypothetical protein n=1 Tax=Nocardioides insulae TaxID=394734 RepID=UPI0003FD4EEF|nr:hypothetical protein [Nocardioides insulae]